MMAVKDVFFLCHDKAHCFNLAPVSVASEIFFIFMYSLDTGLLCMDEPHRLEIKNLPKLVAATAQLHWWCLC